MSEKMRSMRSALVLAFLLFVGSISAQTVKVNVKDSQGEPVIGASVVEQDTKNGGVTDYDGNFTIKLTANKPIVISYIGMKTQTVNAAGKSAIDVVLSDDNTQLEEVVAIGYGTMKRKDVTGSVSSVTGDALTQVPVANVGEALQGKLSGVNIVAQDGRPGGEMAIRVRGGGSITQSNNPLFIVDGIAVSSIDDIPADQIESIDVLKDASSTAIYGARGANGVILVTTKTAKEGKAQVKYNMYYQIKAKPKVLEQQDAYTYVRSMWEYATAQGATAANLFAQYYGLGSANGNRLEAYRGVSGHNYMEDVYGTGHMWNHDLSVSGGTNRTKYFAGVSYTDDDATMKKSGFSRWSVNLKLQQELTKTLKLNVDARYTETKTQYNRFFQNTHNNNTVYPWMYKMIDNPLSDNPTPAQMQDGARFVEDYSNPLVVIDDNNYTKRVQRVRLNTSLTWEIIKNLTAKTELSLARNWSKTETWTGPNGETKTSQAKLAQGDGYNTSWTTTLNYDFADILKSDIHSVSLLVGNEVLGSRSNASEILGYKYPNTWSEEQAFGLMQMAQDRQQSYFENSIGVPSHTISWFGRANYNLLGRYMFTFTMRADGSSKFSKDKRWGYFPAGAFAWRISDEPFLANTKDWMDNLKLRLSIGTSGNDGIDAAAFIDKWVSTRDGQGSYSYVTGDIMGNPDLTWEKTISRNIGLDYSFLNGKFNGAVDFYWNTTKDCLMLVPVNVAQGFSYQFQNAAKTSNKGIEVAFNYNILRKKDLDLSFGVTYNYNVNKVEEVPADANMSGSMSFASTGMNPQKPYLIKEGEPVGLIVGYKSAGFYTVDDFHVNSSGQWVLNDGVADCVVANYKHPYTLDTKTKRSDTGQVQRAFPGMPKYEDTDGNGVIDANDATVIGRMAPQHTGGFHINARYKSFDFSANFAYQLDGKVFNANLARSISTQGGTKTLGSARLSSDFDNNMWRMYDINAAGDLVAVTNQDALRALNANAQYGTLTYVNDLAPVISDDYIESAAFLRMQSLTIGYTFPKPLINKIGLSNARVYVTAGNLFCITGYKGLDPEVNTDGSMDATYKGFPTPGFDYNSYPRSRTFTFGLNVAF